eukprot:763822-Amorphochlora_amoeboformis.AAC.1
MTLSFPPAHASRNKASRFRILAAALLRRSLTELAATSWGVRRKLREYQSSLHGFAPLSRRRAVSATCPSLAARCSGVLPFEFGMSTGDFNSISTRAISTEPRSAAWGDVGKSVFTR